MRSTKSLRHESLQTIAGNSQQQPETTMETRMPQETCATIAAPFKTQMSANHIYLVWIGEGLQAARQRSTQHVRKLRHTFTHSRMPDPRFKQNMSRCNAHLQWSCYCLVSWSCCPTDAQRRPINNTNTERLSLL